MAIVRYKIVNKRAPDHRSFRKKVIVFIPCVKAVVDYSFLNIILNLENVVIFYFRWS